ncbi:hypothetical protein [Gordonia sp. CPCC 205333]|uniref:hypothetical protein n=1 Tax=Gordonia sp. CPCC 205333 TaxID=3140790 RepID=UPI003AF3D1F3
MRTGGWVGGGIAAVASALLLAACSTSGTPASETGAGYDADDCGGEHRRGWAKPRHDRVGERDRAG